MAEEIYETNVTPYSFSVLCPKCGLSSKVDKGVKVIAETIYHPFDPDPTTAIYIKCERCELMEVIW